MSRDYCQPLETVGLCGKRRSQGRWACRVRRMFIGRRVHPWSGGPASAKGLGEQGGPRSLHTPRHSSLTQHPQGALLQGLSCVVRAVGGRGPGTLSSCEGLDFPGIWRGVGRELQNNPGLGMTPACV